jgi:RNA polymerase sigma-70 factor (ECF subfamily)
MKRVDPSFAEETASHTHLSVVHRAQADDAEAWEQLVRAYSRRIYRWCRMDGLQAADAANLVQEVLRSVASGLAEFRHDRAGDTFRGWLRRITENKIRDHFRRERRQVAHAAGGTDAYEQLANLAGDAEASAWWVESRLAGTHAPQLDPAIVAQVRNEFSARDWRLFWRVVVDGQSAGEAGAEVGASANAARLVKMRILRRLRELVSNCGRELSS